MLPSLGDCGYAVPLSFFFFFSFFFLFSGSVLLAVVQRSVFGGWKRDDWVDKVCGAGT